MPVFLSSLDYQLCDAFKLFTLRHCGTRVPDKLDRAVCVRLHYFLCSLLSTVCIGPFLYRKRELIFSCLYDPNMTPGYIVYMDRWLNTLRD